MAEHGIDDELRGVQPGVWLDELQAARGQGFTFLDHLVCIDELGRSPELRLVARLVDFGAEPPRGLQLHVRLPREQPELVSATSVFAGAAWHEREAHDFFGVVFHTPAGEQTDSAPLLNHTGAALLRKDQVPAARAAQPWPGAKEPGEQAGAASRRRMAPPGVPDPTVWGDRDPSAPVPSPDEVVAAASGGRVRRRR
ncbi:NADH-quinone oxidoreductase subunit C [Luteococcus peritonei]|uniref:NADH-quinone oxidoreductase subunit C n=1 Tax=Luteococcus peritonei TaxID=88874 RepID=A0ABW4RVB4_9ACTN